MSTPSLAHNVRGSRYHGTDARTVSAPSLSASLALGIVWEEDMEGNRVRGMFSLSAFHITGQQSDNQGGPIQ